MKLMLVLVCLWLSTGPAAADPLRGGGEDPMRGGNAADAAPSAPAEPQFVLPAILRPVVAAAVVAQTSLNKALQGRITALDGGKAPLGAEALGIIAIGFLYGIIHAAGPGHGKLVVGTYFASRRARLAHGLALSAAMSLTQAISAIVLVVVFALVLETSTRDLVDKTNWLETASYALIAVLGMVGGWRALRGGHACCAHGPEDGHEHHHHDHDHHDHHDHHHHAEPRAMRLREMAAAALAVGARPCSGAIILLVFTLAHGVLWVGIMATLAMAVGATITVSAASLGGMGVHALISGMADHHPRLADWTRRGTGLIGAATLTVVGLVMTVASVMQTGY